MNWFGFFHCWLLPFALTRLPRFGYAYVQHVHLNYSSVYINCVVLCSLFSLFASWFILSHETRLFAFSIEFWVSFFFIHFYVYTEQIHIKSGEFSFIEKKPNTQRIPLIHNLNIENYFFHANTSHSFFLKTFFLFLNTLSHTIFIAFSLSCFLHVSFHFFSYFSSCRRIHRKHFRTLWRFISVIHRNWISLCP